MAAAVLAAAMAIPVRAEARGADYFTNLPFVTQDGQTVRLWDDVLKDRIVVITFFYVDCPSMCSLSTARLAQLYQWLGERMGRDVVFVSITLDPENDTPADLRTFADAFGAGPGWYFLTGTRENIDTVRARLGEKSQELSEHRSDFVLGNAGTGHWRRSSAMGSLAIAFQSILEMDPDWRGSAFGSTAASPAGETYDLAAHPGEAIFLKTCASCHTIGLGRKIGPDLAAVTLRRDEDWLARFLMDPAGMLAEGDPVAVALEQDYPGARMPDLGLGPVDAADLVAYLRAADQALIENEARLAQMALDGEQASVDAAAAHDHASHDHAAP